MVCNKLTINNFIMASSEKLKDDLEAVQERLRTLPEKLSHDIMVSNEFNTIPINQSCYGRCR